MKAIRIDILDKTYQSEDRVYTTITDFQLQIKQHEFVCLVGASGCGKTTLLNIVAGLDKHFHGSIAWSTGEKLSHIGYVFQNPRLLPWYSVRQNIELVFSGLVPKESIDNLLKAMQLYDVQDLHPSRLSLGMQRRVAIIRAFAIDPELLLLDEPFVSLDAPSARHIRGLLNELWLHRPHTVLMVSHDLREAITMADRLIFLSALPMQILADIPVGLSRNERNEPAKIEAFKLHLLNHYPNIQALL